MGWEDTLPIDRFLPKPKGSSNGPRRTPGGFNKGGFTKPGFNKSGNSFNKGGFNKSAP